MAISELELETLSAILWLDRMKRTGAKVEPSREFLSKSQMWLRPGRDVGMLDETLAKLNAAGLVETADSLYQLTDEGTAKAKQYTSEEFGKWAGVIEKSKACQMFCEKVYGASRSQMNMLTEKQLSKLIEVLHLGKEDRLLDLGCGLGGIAEHIADVTGAEVLGVDFSAKSIQVAQERPRDKSVRVSFQVMDMDDLNLPEGGFDAVIAIDTLYFVQDLNSVVTAAKQSLGERGRMGIMYTTHVSQEGPRQKLEPGNTPLAGALRSCGLDFKTWDYTEDETGVWERQVQAAGELESLFEAEGNLKICQERVQEANFWLEFCRDGRSSRYLYYASR